MHRPYVCAARAHRRTPPRLRNRAAAAVATIQTGCTFPNVIIFARGLVRAFVTPVSRARARVFLSVAAASTSRRRRRGFSRQYANAFRWSGG